MAQIHTFVQAYAPNPQHEMITTGFHALNKYGVLQTGQLMIYPFKRTVGKKQYWFGLKYQGKDTGVVSFTVNQSV